MMATYIERGDSLFIPFRNGQSISDSQCKPRMYKSLQNFEKSFPKHNLGNKNIEVVEYAEVKHGEWIDKWDGKYANPTYVCSNCGEKALLENYINELNQWRYRQSLSISCPFCGAKMDGGNEV